METKKDKLKRYTFWAVGLIVTSLVAAIFVPAEKLPHFVDLVKDIVTHLVIG
jgi:hypothetical protein